MALKVETEIQCCLVAIHIIRGSFHRTIVGFPQTAIVTSLVCVCEVSTLLEETEVPGVGLPRAVLLVAAILSIIGVVIVCFVVLIRRRRRRHYVER